ncbi:ABC transporter permease [Spirochaetia bacterium]|nr:ABC transporter permease [Spirochaetia bacterium]
MRKKYQYLVILPAVIFVIVALFPVYWTLNTSIKTQAEVYLMRPALWPHSPTLNSYRSLIFERHFLNNLRNSFFVSVIVALLSVAVSSLAAYAFARLRFFGRRALGNSILYAYLMPRSVMFIPLYVLITNMGLQNTLVGLGWIYPTFTIPYATWMLISYFRTIPIALEEAAKIDGCGRMRSLFQIVLPLASPGIAATIIFSFTLCWSEYQYALVTITSSVFKTLTLALSEMVVADVYAWGPLMAGSIIATLPVMLMYIVGSKQLVSGLTLGGVK